jgi:hypothetical protein
MKRTLFIINLLISFTLTTCHEVFEPQLETPNEQILVVDGAITNEAKPYSVRLSYAKPFTADYTTEIVPAKGALVYIGDNFGNQEILAEKAGGLYESSGNGIRGVIGRKYYLYIRTADGNTYEAAAETMMPAPSKVDVNGVAAENKYLEANSNGDLNQFVRYGLNMKIDIQSPGGQPGYYHLKTRATNQTTYVEWPRGRCSTCPFIIYYCWDSNLLEKLPNVVATKPQENTYISKMHNLGFLQEFIYNPYDTTAIKDAALHCGWILTTFIYSISENEYQYLTKLHDQLEAKNVLFDPIPTQLEGNIKCTSNEDKKVFGYFSVASRSLNFFYFNYIRQINEIEKVQLATGPDALANGCQKIEKPWFWYQ